MAYLDIKNFNKTFADGFKVLNNVNFNLEKGQVLSIIGSSGSGKTTLLRCLNFLTLPDTGTMTLDNKIVFNADYIKEYKESVLREKRLNFGLVFQSFNLFPQYTVLQNVTLAPSLLHGNSEKIKQEALDLLKKVGLIDKINSYPCELSGGQCQRVAIARALALKPKVLCFDEPTSALDPELTGEVLKVIRSLKNENITMIIVSHEIGFVKKVSDKILFMSKGEIVESGTPSEVLDNPKTEKLVTFLSSVNNKDGE